MLEKFFDPKSIAVIGASSDKNKVGYSLTFNLLHGKERKIFPVSIKEKEILGIPAFASVLDISENIDLAIIAVRADIVPEILIDCGKKQISNVIIISSGFKEIGPSGKELEEQIKKIAREQNITLLGPNCLGVIDTQNNLNASFSAKKPMKGNIALLSQSGALGTAMLDWALGEGVGFSKFISLGNEAILSEIDFLKYLCNDDDTNAILIYLEKISDGEEFIRIVSETTKKKPIVILKAGVSDSGIKAVMSHTGSLAPEAKVFASACKQAGAIMVPSLRKFFNVSKLLHLGVSVNKPVTNLLVLTNGGGPSVIAADEIDLSNSLSLVELNEDTKEKLRKVLPPMAAVGNPVDIIGDALSQRYEKALDILSEVENADGIIVMLTPQMMTETEATAKLLAKYKDKKKIFPVFIGGPSIQAGRNALIESGLVNFVFSKDVVYGLDSLANMRPKSQIKKTEAPTGVTVSQMSFADTSKLLDEYDISISGKFVANKDSLVLALETCGGGPYAMKAMSSSIVHKTDVGAVILNIKNTEEAEKAWDEAHEKNQNANIEGMLVQKMEKGREVIIGMKRDATFGPTILFGLGGIFAESIKDTTLRIAPISRDEALKMMHEIKGAKILEGMRGEPPVNFDALADIIVNLSRLALDHSEIKEIDLNPVIATDTSATIVDARVMI